MNGTVNKTGGRAYRRSIMIVDDEFWFLESLKEILSDKFEVMGVSNGKDCLDKFIGSRIDMIVLDIAMPEMDGIEVLQKIRELNPWIPVVIMTGHSTLGRAEAATSLGVQGYIKKPFDSELFKEKIDSILKSRELQLVTTGIQGMTITSVAELKDTNFAIIRHLHHNYHRHLALKELAAISGQSVSNLCRSFKDGTGVTVLAYHQNLKLYMARRLLLSSNYSISTVAKLIGMEDESYFSRIFKREMGMSAIKFRKESNVYAE